jgi:hypothetical protein
LEITAAPEVSVEVAELTGLDADLLESALPLLLASPAALTAVDNDPGMLAPVAALATGELITKTPIATAVMLSEHLRVVAGSLSEPAAVRRIADAVLARLELELRGELSTPRPSQDKPSQDKPSQVVEALVLVGRAREVLVVGGETASVLAAALTACAALRMN